MKHGIKTEEFGLWLIEHLKKNDEYSVYYDHGNPLEAPTVVVIKGFFGQKVTNRNRLTDVDVMVVKNHKEIVLLIEIEETRMSPKKILGDIFSTLMCNRFAVRTGNENKCFDVSSQTSLIIAGVVPNSPNQGNDLNKIREIIEPRLQKFHAPDDALQIDNIKIVTEVDISKTLEKLKNEVRGIFAMS